MLVKTCLNDAKVGFNYSEGAVELVLPVAFPSVWKVRQIHFKKREGAVQPYKLVYSLVRSHKDIPLWRC